MRGTRSTSRADAGFPKPSGTGGTRRPWRPRPLLAALLLLAAPAFGCRTDSDVPREPSLTAAEFVDIITALREAERAVAREDSAPQLFEARKAEILAGRDATEGQLRSFVLAHRENPTFLAEVWDTITERLKHVPDSFESDQRRTRLPQPVPPPGAEEQRLH